MILFSVTSIPVRKIDSSVSERGPQLMFSIVNVRTQEQSDGGSFLRLRGGSAGPNKSAVPLPSRVSLVCGGLMIVIEKVQLALLLAASVAVQVTGVVPTGKAEPEGGVQTTVPPGKLSEKVGAGNVTVSAPHSPGNVVIVMGAGQVIVGAVWSFIVTVKAQVEVLPRRSVAVQVTRVTPGKNVELLGGVHSTVGPGQSSNTNGGG